MAKRQTCESTVATKYLKTDDKQFVCSICIEHYRSPRYLPTCGHTFCENCLLKYTRNVQFEQEGEAQERKFECPVCRKPNNLPDSDVTLQWVQTFPLNTVITKMMEAIPQLCEEMRERKTCDPCKQEGEVTAGLKFCLDCKEVLCKTCLKCHKNFKVSRDHKLIDIADIPAEKCHVDFFKDVGKCAKHPERDVDVFCKTHDAVVCAMCLVSDHKACEMIDIACHNIDTTKLQHDSEVLISRMKETIEHCNFLQNLRTENKNNLKQKLKEIRVDFQELRDQIVEQIDNAVSHVSDVMKQIEIEREDGLDVEMARVSKIQKFTAQSVAQLEAIQQYGSEKHKFVSAHLMKKRYFEETFKQIADIDNNVKQLDAELELTPNLMKLSYCRDVEKLVEIKITESESSHKSLASVLTPPKDTGDVENVLRDCKLIKAEEHTICPKDETEHQPAVHDISLFGDERLILTDVSSDNGIGYLYVYNVSNRTLLSLTLTKKAFSAAPIDDTRIAVSSPHDSSITIVSVGNELREERTLQTPYRPQSIQALNNGQLAVVWGEVPLAFGVIEVHGESVVEKLHLDQDINGRKFTSFNSVAVDERRQHVIQPCCIERVVHCFDFTGRPVFAYRLQDEMEPLGVALDKCGNIYVIDNSDPGSIHKLSPTGDPISIIMDGIPPFPTTICSDAMGTGFWVTEYAESHDKVAHFRLL